ncbi:MAG TPA: hypothetical protein VM099_08650 [Gemmatimonadaceae bacterium]|nr:hypothetical protein [Gemmatimonadaceae bacterium]
MDLYTTLFALGALGLIAMAFSGLGRHGRGADGHAGHAGHGGHGHAGHAHAGHTHVGHSHAGHDHGVHAAAPHSHSAHTPAGSRFLSLMSPRVLFSVCLGLGTAGLVLRPLLPEPLLFGASLGVGILFDRLLVAPLWNFMFRFASTPALTLESAVSDEARAVTSFDANGQGLIAVELDGQSVQLLGTLQSSDREMHVRVPAGARLRIEEVDSARNRCIVSLA